MIRRLAYRNMKRFAGDYQIYMITLAVVAALLYAFDSLFWDKELGRFDQMNQMMMIMVGLATGFVVIITAWLIYYIIHFMMERRSREFGIYLLLGMKKGQVARVYIRENIMLGGIAFLVGSVLGVFFQQILCSVIDSMVRIPYSFRLSWDYRTWLMTFGCYAGCYLLAFFRCGFSFRKMNINELMKQDRKNEEIVEKHEEWKRILLPMAVIFLILFWGMFTHLNSTGEIILFLIGLVLTIYLFYTGVSAWIICYVRRKGKGIYQGQRLFLLRQFASKIRTMQFTLGTLTSLFTLALLGASVAFMFCDYENTALKAKFPFDVLIYSDQVRDDFQDEKEVLQQEADVKEMIRYHIYTDQKDQVNTWMLTHLEQYGTMYQNKNGKPDRKRVTKMLENDGTYCRYDTYMGQTDYNRLRKMLGYETVHFEPDQYIVQTKKRLQKDVASIGKDLHLTAADEKTELTFAGVQAEPFSQDGHNGGDYIVVVGDKVLQRMKPYYSELAVDLKGETPQGLEQKLDALADPDDRDFSGHTVSSLSGNSCSGSDTVLVYTATNLVRDNLIPELKMLLASMIVPLFYMGLVFVCVALTVLSVQQLSDSSKYKFRYDVLEKIGLSQKQVRSLLLRQMAGYYLCPALLALVISGKMVLCISGNFVRGTGVSSRVSTYFVEGTLLFMGIYLVYFAVTFLCFQRSIFLKER